MLGRRRTRGDVMLRAAPANDGALELVRLTLLLVQNHREYNISKDLKSYFVRVVSEAKQLTSDPANSDSNVLPESIELALRMKLYAELFQDMENISDISAVSPELAGKLLRKMENQPVYADQFAFAP